MPICNEELSLTLSQTGFLENGDAAGWEHKMPWYVYTFHKCIFLYLYCYDRYWIWRSGAYLHHLEDIKVFKAMTLQKMPGVLFLTLV